MKGASYRERDYAFGQIMLTLRIATGLTQAGVATHLGVSRKAVGEWEAGISYPKTEHLKVFIALATGHQAFAAGREEEEIRALWQMAHQKVLFDEAWLSTLLPHAEVPPSLQSDEETPGTSLALPSPEGGPRVDWGDALAVTAFYGRGWELNLLAAWMVEERCRVVSVLGMGGIGKSALATKMMHRVAERFEVVIWRSLRDAPTCEALLEDCLQVLAPQALRDMSASLEKRLSLLLECLRSSRVLLVLDNLETLLEEGQGTGHMRPGYEGYTRLLSQVAETKHQSCLLLTSREKPSDLVPLEGNRAPVRVLRLARLDVDSCEQLLAAKEVAGTSAELARLIEAYAGNPLALKIVAQTIVDLFNGQVTLFLEQGEVVFGGVRELLAEQYARLSAVERTVLLWLAILREPVAIEELLAVLGTPLSRAQVLEAVEALRRRSLVERGKRLGCFTLQSVVLEYATERFLAEIASEIEQGTLLRLIDHGLELATAKEYVRQTQQRLLVAPLLAQLRNVYPQRAALEQQLFALLDQLRARADYAQGYGPANVLALLREHWGHLRGVDLSQLVIRGASLQGVEMQDATLAGATLRETVFTEALDAIWAVATSLNGQSWAAGSRRGEVRVWRESGKLLYLAWQAHTSTVATLAFSPDGRTLATGSWDGAIKLRDVESGALLWMSWQTDIIHCVAFSPDGHTLASGGDGATIRLWDASSGTHLQMLTGHSGPVHALTWSPDGSLLASGGFDMQIRLWKMQEAQPETSVGMLVGHTNWVFSLAFAPDRRTLASASFDRTVKLWDVDSLSVRETLTGHTDLVFAVAWSPDGRFLASSGWDNAIQVWDASMGESRQTLRDPDHVETLFFGVAWSPNGKFLASGSYQRGVQVWEVTTGNRRWVGRGHPTRIRRMAWSPDGTRLAGGGDDGSVCLWQASDGTLLQQFEGHRGRVASVAWSPDGSRLASGGGSSGSGEIFVWDALSGERLYTLNEPSEIVCALAWDPTGSVLVSGGGDGMLRWWDLQHGECVRVRKAHQGAVQSLKHSPDGRRLASCGDDGVINVWDLQSGQLLQTLRRDRPYERLDITGIRGVTEAQKATLRALGAMENAPVPGTG